MLPRGSPGIRNPPTHIRGRPGSVWGEEGSERGRRSGVRGRFMNEEGGRRAGPVTPGGRRGSLRPRVSMRGLSQPLGLGLSPRFQGGCQLLPAPPPTPGVWVGVCPPGRV